MESFRAQARAFTTALMSSFVQGESEEVLSILGNFVVGHFRYHVMYHVNINVPGQ